VFEGFQNPALALGALAALVPLVIHLLNRRRHRPLAFGALRFVLAAYRRTRRRAQMENWLLLALRMLAVALLAFALARPFSAADGPLALLAEERRDVVLILDASASTGYRENVASVFETIVERAREHVADLDASRGDRVRILLADGTARLIAWRSPEEAQSALAALDEPSDGALDLAAALSELRRIITAEAAGDGAGLEIRLLTDVQRRVFVTDEVADALADDVAQDAPTPGAAAVAAADKLAGAGANSAAPSTVAASAAEPWRAELDALFELGARILVEDLGPPETLPPNLGIQSVGPVEPLLGPGLPLELEVAVTNRGAAAALVRVSLAIDGERLPARALEVPAGGVARALFPAEFDRAGPHLLEGSLEGDRLVFDDRRAAVVHVPAPVRLLAVNGAPDRTDIERDALGLWLAALSPADDGDGALGGFVPFAVHEVDALELAADDLDLDTFDAIVIAGVDSLSSAAVARLEARVRAGAGLLIAPGEASILEAWNERLFRPDGTGLLPAQMMRRIAVASRRTGYFRVARFDESHPALSFFAEPRWRPLFTEVPFYEFASTRPLADAKVLAQLDDELQSPLLIERAFGAGRVLLFTSSLDPAWNRLALSARTLVPFAHEIVRHAAHRDPPRRTLGIGAMIQARFETFPRNPVLTAPSGARRPVEIDPVELQGGFELGPIAGADRAGVWRVDTDTGERAVFAVQADPREGNLERLGSAALADLHPALAAVNLARAADDGAAAPLAGGELWRPIALACLLALIAESLFAAFLGRRRARA